MPSQFTEELSLPVDPHECGTYFLDAPISEGRRLFCFQLFRKSVRFGDAQFEQLWMHPQSVYGQRGIRGANRNAIMNYFWASCLAEGSAADTTDIREIILLANLLPLVRSNGSRRVLADGRERRHGPRDLAELDALLATSRDSEMSYLEFQRTTGELLGPPIYDAEAQAIYHEVVAEMFEHIHGEVLPDLDAAQNTLCDQWTERMRTIGRHRGNDLQKRVLDAISYEARAAMHRCYSHVWLRLIKLWNERGELSSESYNFHGLWHLELLDSADNSALPNSHLFHGHIFGLHPACSSLIRTNVGQELIGQWSSTTQGTALFESRFRQLLHATVVAIQLFSARRSEIASMRSQPWSIPPGTLDQL